MFLSNKPLMLEQNALEKLINSPPKRHYANPTIYRDVNIKRLAVIPIHGVLTKRKGIFDTFLGRLPMMKSKVKLHLRLMTEKSILFCWILIAVAVKPMEYLI